MFVLVVDSVIEDDNIVPILVKPVDNVETTTEDDESFFTPLGKYLSFYVLQTVIKESICMYICMYMYVFAQSLLYAVFPMNHFKQT